MVKVYVLKVCSEIEARVREKQRGEREDERQIKKKGGGDSGRTKTGRGLWRYRDCVLGMMKMTKGGDSNPTQPSTSQAGT